MRKILLLILVLFISGFAGNAQQYSGISAVLPPIIWVAGAPLNLRSSVFRQIHRALLSDAHGHQLRPAKEVMQQLSNYGGGILYNYTPDQYRAIAQCVNANTLYQAEIVEFQLQTVTYRKRGNDRIYKKYQMHINMILNQIDADDGTPHKIGEIEKDFDSTDSELFPPSQEPLSVNRFSDQALATAVQMLIGNIADANNLSQ